MRRLALVLAGLLLTATTTSCLVFHNRWRTTLAVQTASDVAYLDDGDDKHRLDIFAPSGARGAPVVIFVHGGFWRSGDRSYFENVVGLYGNVGVALADMGVVTVIPSYRLYPQVGAVDDMLDDLGAVIRFTRDHIAVHGGDPDRIILAGHSAGGQLVTLLATSPDALKRRGIEAGVIKGVAGISGIYDVLASANSADPPKDKAELWDPLFGSDDHKQAASPLPLFGTTDHPPLLLLVGDADFRSCLRDFNSAQTALQPLQGSRAFFVRIAGNTHEDMVLEIGTATDEVGPAVAAFARVITDPARRH